MKTRLSTGSAAASPVFEDGVEKGRSWATLSETQPPGWGVEGLTFSVSLFFLLWLTFVAGESISAKENTKGSGVPILLYHRFGSVIEDNMTVKTTVFETHLKYLRDSGYTVIPLRLLVNHYLRKGPPIPLRSVVITVDDGHKSVYTDLFPLVKKYYIPTTLFLYSSALSNASYAMTWDQLRELRGVGLFDFQSHTIWHPNFNIEKRRLKPDEYEKFVRMQLMKSKERVEKELDVKVDMLAWPFGIYDDELVRIAAETGYVAAFTMERRQTTSSDHIMKLPRYLMVHTGNNLLPF